MNIINFPFPTSKIYLRNQIKQEFETFDNELLISKSEKIVDSLINSDIINYESFFLYMPIKYEVDISKFVNYLLENNKKVIIPKIVDDGIMIGTQLNSIENTIIGKYNILESRSSEEYQGNIDVMLVPGLGFTKYGERLGRGKGYYDRFLEKYEMLKVGICFDFQILNYIPVGKYDIRMDMLVTENRFMKF